MTPDDTTFVTDRPALDHIIERQLVEWPEDERARLAEEILANLGGTDDRWIGDGWAIRTEDLLRILTSISTANTPLLLFGGQLGLHVGSALMGSLVAFAMIWHGVRVSKAPLTWEQTLVLRSLVEPDRFEGDAAGVLHRLPPIEAERLGEDHVHRVLKSLLGVETLTGRRVALVREHEGRWRAVDV